MGGCLSFIHKKFHKTLNRFHESVMLQVYTLIIPNEMKKYLLQSVGGKDGIPDHRPADKQ